MLTTRPDQGYAWCVLVVAFLYNVIEGSVYMSPAVYMIDWLGKFNTSTANIGFVASMMNGVNYFTGKSHYYAIDLIEPNLSIPITSVCVFYFTHENIANLNILKQKLVGKDSAHITHRKINRSKQLLKKHTGLSKNRVGIARLQ